MKITIPGQPIAKKRPRFARRGKFTVTYSDQETEEGKFLLLAKEQITHKAIGALAVDCQFFFRRPKSHYGTGKNRGNVKASAPLYHTSKPDVDNCIKFVFDGLNELAWHDDAQIVTSVSGKHYAVDGDPRTEITIREAEGLCGS